MSRLDLVPISFSTSSSTGRPWQSHPALRVDVMPAHRPVARVHVLERAGLDVADVGLAVRRRGAVVEDPLGSARAQVDAAAEDVALAPELEHPLLERGQVDLRLHRPVSRHPAASRRLRPRGAQEDAPSPVPGTRRVPRGTTLLGGPSRARPLTGRADPGRTPTAVTGGARPRLLRARRPGSGGGSGRMFAGSGRRARTVPGSLSARLPGYSFPSTPLTGIVASGITGGSNGFRPVPCGGQGGT